MEDDFVKKVTMLEILEIGEGRYKHHFIILLLVFLNVMTSSLQNVEHTSTSHIKKFIESMNHFN